MNDTVNKMTWRQMIPTAVTLTAMLCGFFSILFSLEGAAYYQKAAQFIMLAMILDGIDGNLARKLKGSSDIGAELDTYVDMTAFGLAPAVLIYQVTMRSPNFIIWRVIMTALVVLSGVVRLARFKSHDPLRGQGGYCGLPITAAAGWVALFVFLSLDSRTQKFFALDQGPVSILFIAGILLMITLQVSNFRYPKPTKTPIMFIPCVILVVLLFIPNSGIAVFSAFAIITLGLLYVLFGPLFAKLKKQSA